MEGRDTKELVVNKAPKRIKELQFGVLSSQDVLKQAVVEVSDRALYDFSGSPTTERPITKNGPLDKRMGISSRSAACETCGEELKTCNGHFGYIRLALPVFHIGFLKTMVEMLHCICKRCARILLPEHERRKYLTQLRRSGLDNLQRMGICKKIVAECKKVQRCHSCNFLNGIVRKVPHHPLKIVHKRFEKYEKSTAKSKTKPPELVEWEKKFEVARGFNPDVEKHWKKVQDDMTPLRALQLFKMISDPDAELLGMNPDESRPEDYIWQYLPIPPVTIRPSVAQESSTTEDDLTNKIGEIVHVNGIIKAGLKQGAPMQTLMEQWDFMGLVIAMYINSDIPGIKDLAQANLKSIRGFCQRLKGKQGRFRGNLSGKRVDFSGRTVIGPDPNLGIDEVAVPEKVAVNLTYPERVNAANLKRLQETVMRGQKHPGANYIVKKGGIRIRLEVLLRHDDGPARAKRAAENLQIGDIVERHLIDGDIVLFNRQPSLHKLSILSHKAKIRPWRTFRLNECVCNPYNADFDGDEMNLHVPQTEEARAEAIELMGVKNNLATPKNGTPIIAAIQDFITCAYLLSNKQQFFDRSSFAQIIGYMFNATTFKDPDTKEEQGYELPAPAILKPAKLWTGKQVFNVLMRPSRKCKVLINLEAPCKEFKPEAGRANDLNKDDAWLVVRNSEVMCGVMDKATVGDGKKDSVFYVMMRDYGPDYAVLAMNRLAKLSARWLSTQGFSLGIGDVTPGPDLRAKKQKLNDAAYEQCSTLIKQYKEGRIKRDPGCDEYQTMENQVSGILSKVRQQAGDVCFAELSRWNAPMLMAKCGSKGSNINVSQMVAGVGQQMIGNKRVVNGFDERTLPHFKKGSVDPDSKGYVSDSFFDGLNPTEFIFHAMSGREGLVDTAVKTAETGYMSRRLIKSLEDLSAGYDKTVRNSSQAIVQFQYGDDHLDPVDMEGKAKPVNFDRTYNHAVTVTWSSTERCLLPYEIRQITKSRLDKERVKYPRMSLIGEPMKYDDRSDRGIDDWESVRDFLDKVQQYIFDRADTLHRIRTRLGLLDANEDSGHGIDYDAADNASFFSVRDGLAKLSLSALTEFIDLCLYKYHRSTVEPGHAVGAVGAQSIGEPGTQMTLKTFHFAGVAGMSITQGVPRIKEIINASKTISTPIISCPLLNPTSEMVAQIVKSRIEKTYLRDVISHIDDTWHRDGHQLDIKVNQKTIDGLHLGISIHDIESRIRRTKALKMDSCSFMVRGNKIRIMISDGDGSKKRGVTSRTKKELQDHFFRVQTLGRQLGDVMISGYPDCNRAVISRGQKDANGLEPLSVAIEGYGLRQCMTTEGVDGLRTKTNSVMEVKEVLGIEAARQTIIREIGFVMNTMDIDPRHMQLLADVMTYKGDVYGITRFGMAKMRDSVLQLASFEKTPDHLFDAAVHSKKDPIEGVSECIIMGQSMSIGTGSFQVVREMCFDEGDLGETECLFKQADDWMNAQLKGEEEMWWGAEDETLDEEE